MNLCNWFAVFANDTLSKPYGVLYTLRISDKCPTFNITYLTTTLRKWWAKFSPIFRINQELSAFLQACFTFHGTEISIPVTKCLFFSCSDDIKNVPSNVLLIK